MTAIAGSIESISLKGREFAVPADAEAQRKLGGDENEVMANGNGTSRIIKTKVIWSITGLSVETDDMRGDAEFLQGLADSKDFFPVNIKLASGAVYAGRGMLTGELTTSSQNATTAINLSGSGKLAKQ